jgi:Ni/Co efflux regulator RcnB
MSRSVLTAAVLLCACAGTTAIAGTPPHWANEQNPTAQGNSNADRDRDARDEGHQQRGGDWKRSSDPQRNEPRASNPPARPAPVQNHPPAAHNPEQRPPSRQAPDQGRPPVSHGPVPGSRDHDDRGRGNNDDRGRWSNDDHGRSKQDDRGGHVYARDPRPDTDWARHQREQARRTFDRDHWRDDRGRDWNHDRGWYDHYRVDHFRYRNGRYFARERFRLNFYVFPYGYYRHSWMPGEFLPYSYFDDGYTLGDYWTYGLYDPPYGCEWVRVDGDALLVDMQTGEVLDTVYDLFY